jgi:eukaryotic translation initiation factor 2C
MPESTNIADLCIMALDICHGGSLTSKKSTVTLTCSLEGKFVHYATVVFDQPNPRMEIVENLESLVLEALSLYHRRNKKYPKHFLFFRDGVGETHYETVRRKECLSLNRALESLGINPSFTFVVVQKRNHFKSFLVSGDSQNPSPGTFVGVEVVDEGIYENFYLYTHKAIIGTARPAHYHLLENSLGFTPYKLGYFTFWISHLYQGIYLLLFFIFLRY